MRPDTEEQICEGGTVGVPPFYAQGQKTIQAKDNTSILTCLTWSAKLG